MDLHKWTIDLHKSFMDLHNSFIEIHNSFMEIHNSCLIMDLHNWFMDLHKSIYGEIELWRSKNRFMGLHNSIVLVPTSPDFVIGFNHGLPCYVKNMARGTQVDKRRGRRPRFLSWLRPEGRVFYYNMTVDFGGKLHQFYHSSGLN